MSLTNNKIKGDLSFLPLACNIQETTWKSKIIENASNKRLDDFERQVVYLILNKEKWKKEDYVTFKENITKLEYKDLVYSKSSIIKILQMDSKSLLEELYKFSMVQDYYPFSKRIKKNDNNGYIIKQEKIKETDSYKLVLEITRKIKSFITRLVSDILKEEDPYIFIDLLIDILNNKDEISKEQLLSNFDNNFAYLKDFTIFQDIYTEYRKYFFNNLISSTASIMGTANARYKRRVDINIYDYVKSKVIRGVLI